MKCISIAELREQVFRGTPDLREHITFTGVIIVLLDENGNIESIHHPPPLFTFPRAYTSTKLAQSMLDPNNLLPPDKQFSSVTFARSSVQAAFSSQSPPGIPAPTEFVRYVCVIITKWQREWRHRDQLHGEGSRIHSRAWSEC
jgi:hypothetical protein